MLNLDSAVFIEKTKSVLNPRDINEGVFKATVFGLLFSTICTYEGFHTKGGASGVGNATNRGVVKSMVGIIIIDYFLTKFCEAFASLT